MSSSGYNPFDFIKNRRASVEPTNTDKEEFDCFMSTLVLSMRRNKLTYKDGNVVANSELPMENLLDDANSIPFSRLTKKQQCMAFTSLDGNNLYGRWAKPKKKQSGGNKHTDMVEKLMLVFDCSMSDAEYYIDRGLVNEKELQNTYDVLYNPQALLDKMDKSKSKRKKKGTK